MAAGAAQPVAPAEPLRLSEIVGREVRSEDGERIGAIRDLLLDRRTGKIEQVLLDDERVYPLDALKAGEGEEVLIEEAGGQAAGATAPAAEARLVRASALIARELRDPSGRALGRVTDLLVDPMAGELRAAVLEDGKAVAFDARFLER